MKGRRSLFLYAVFFMFSSTVVDAGKIFKWTDDEGNVHFGQRPPGGNQKVVTVKGAQSSVNPQERDGRLYCGDIQLQYKNRYSSSRYGQKKQYQPSAFTLEKKIIDWKRSRKRSQDDLSRYLIRISKINPNRSSRYSRSQADGFFERKEQLTKKIAQYNCAIDWAEEKVLALKVNSSSVRDGYKKAEQDLRSARKQQLEICGREPASYNEYGEARATYRAWEKCQRRYGAVVRKMERKFRDAQRGLNKVN